MERFSFFGKDRVKLTIEALYSRCDIVLVPTIELDNWLIVDGVLNSEVQKRVDKNTEVMQTKMKPFKCVGLHRKMTNEFWMCNGDSTTVWKLSSFGRSFELVFTSQSKHRAGHIYFSSIKLHKKKYAQLLNQIGYSNKTFLAIGMSIKRLFGNYVGYYALNPFIIYEDLTTRGNCRINGSGIPKRKREKNVIPLTINHHKYKIRNGVNVMDTETGRIYPSIAETARRLEYMYGALTYWLKHNLIPPLKRIEKLQKL